MQAGVLCAGYAPRGGWRRGHGTVGTERSLAGRPVTATRPGKATGRIAPKAVRVEPPPSRATAAGIPVGGRFASGNGRRGRRDLYVYGSAAAEPSRGAGGTGRRGTAGVPGSPRVTRRARASPRCPIPTSRRSLTRPHVQPPTRSSAHRSETAIRAPEAYSRSQRTGRGRPHARPPPTGRTRHRRHDSAISYERMFEELSQRQLQQLETVWTTAAKSVHWREDLRYEMTKALATGCTLEHLAAVTGFDPGHRAAATRTPPGLQRPAPHRPPRARPRPVLPVTRTLGVARVRRRRRRCRPLRPGACTVPHADRPVPSGSLDTPCRSIFVFRPGFLAKTSNYLVTLTNFLFESFRLTHHGFQIGGQTSISPRQGINCLLVLQLSLP
jgi:hypothetical protein